MGNENLNIIIDEFTTRQLIINGRNFTVGKLSLLQLTRLAPVILNVITDKTAEFKKIKEEMDNAETLGFVFGLLDENELVTIIGILLNTNDIEFCRSVKSVESISEIIATICELNDLQLILKNVQRIAGSFKKITKI